MQYQSSINTKIHETRAVPAPTSDFGEIGIELELEGKLEPISSPYWQAKNENSLRGGGVEYVAKKPIHLDALPVALKDLQAVLDKSKPLISIRCSTHIHVDVSKLTVQEVYNAIAVYYLLEPVLTSSQPEKRLGNLFCLRLQDAEGLGYDLVQSVKTGRYFMAFHHDTHRYAALNLVAVGKFGSLEFRFLDAMTSTKLIEIWSRGFHKMIHTAKAIPISRALDMYEDMHPGEFVEFFLGKELSSIVAGGKSREKLNTMIHTNYDHVYELSQATYKAQYSLPRELWNPDLLEDSSVSKAGKRRGVWDTMSYQEVYEQAFAESAQAVSEAMNEAPTSPGWVTQTPPPPIQNIVGTNPFEVELDDDDEGF